MLLSIRTMGAKLFAHRNAFRGILKLCGVELNKKRDVWGLIPEYGERLQEHFNSTRENQKRLKYFAKWTNYYLNGSFHELKNRSQKIGVQTKSGDALDRMFKLRQKLVMKRIRQKVGRLDKEQKASGNYYFRK